MKTRLLAAAVAAAVALAVAPAAAAAPAIVGYPSSIASTGDSITRAFDTCPSPFSDCPPNSWATGSNVLINSHYGRILAANPAIAGHSYNDAVTGAEVAELQAQVQSAVSQAAQYVTILIGANDACASTEAAMTPVPDFRAQFAAAMSTLSTGLPNARIYVVSIPDIYRLWEIYHETWQAQFVWTIAGICQSLLARPASMLPADVDRRNRVRQRVIDYNAELQHVCALYIHCRFDGNAVFNTSFGPSDVSTLDFFHPSTVGQAKLAAVTWNAGFDFGDASPPASAASTIASPARKAVAITATDNVGVAGIEYRLGSGGWTRYRRPVSLPAGTTITWRAVDVNGNVEATHSQKG